MNFCYLKSDVADRGCGCAVADNIPIFTARLGTTPIILKRQMRSKKYYRYFHSEKISKNESGKRLATPAHTHAGVIRVLPGGYEQRYIPSLQRLRDILLRGKCTINL